jgi:predicted RNA-binding Zn ribbon-like protein
MTSKPAAPEGLDEVMDFVNTVSLEREDALLGPDALPEWLSAAEMLAGASPEQLAELRRFREALRLSLEANAGDGDAEAAWRSLEPFGRECCLKVEIRDSGPVLRAEGTGEGAVIGSLFAKAYDAVATGTWARLKACRNPSCRRAYYDRSKNGSGAWCSMAVCGNRMKAKRRRQRLVSEP